MKLHALVLALPCGLALSGMTMADEPAPATREPADLAAPRSVEQPWMSVAEWRRRHEEQILAPNRAAARVVYLGDSITDGWTSSDAFKNRLGALVPLNLGIGGDQTQHLLWRIEAGSLTGLQPRLFVVLIGVNNLGNAYSPAETASGVRAVLTAVRQRFKKTPILLLSILPAGLKPNDELRQKIVATNFLLRDLAKLGGIILSDVGASLLDSGGTLTPDISADALHPTPKGYERLTDAVAPIVEKQLAR